MRTSGLSGAVSDARVPGSGGLPEGYPDAEATGGRGPGPTVGAGGAQGAYDLRVDNDLGGAESGLAGTVGSGGRPGWDGGTGAIDGAGAVALDGSAGERDAPARGDAAGSGGSGGRSGAGGGSASGGMTGLGGSLDAEALDVDSSSTDSSVDEDAVRSDWDAGVEDDVEPDAGDDGASDMAGSPDDDADAPAPPPPETADGAIVDTRPALTLVWEDNFDGEARTGIDMTKWSYVIWQAGQVNNEEQRYTDSRQNVFLDGYGHLFLRGLRSGMQYTSGRIESKAQFKFGRIEVSAKLPAGKGSFPGIVMLGSGSWPQGGEIALMEQYGQDKSWFYASAYADGSAGSGDKRSIRYDFPDATTASSQFHVYSVDWHTDHLVFQVDGHEVMRTSFAASSPFFTTPESIVLDVALGGDMGGTIDTTAFPMDMVVDYVRVYAF